MAFEVFDRSTGRPVRCTCYVDNAKSHIERLRMKLTAVVECPKHSTPGLRELQRRGRECASERR